MHSQRSETTVDDSPADSNDGKRSISLRDVWQRPGQWAGRLAESSLGLWLIGVASFFETIIVPIPIEVILIPYMLARRDLIWHIALVTTLGCLVGAAVGYGLGYFLYDTLGRQLISAMAWEQDFQHFQTWFDNDGFWAVLAIGIIPIPFQVAMLAAGVAGYPILLFMLAATIARGIRYFGLAVLVALVGDQAVSLWERHRTTVGIGLLLIASAVVAINTVAL